MGLTSEQKNALKRNKMYLKIIKSSHTIIPLKSNMYRFFYLLGPIDLIKNKKKNYPKSWRKTKVYDLVYHISNKKKKKFTWRKERKPP